MTQNIQTILDQIRAKRNSNQFKVISFTTDMTTDVKWYRISSFTYLIDDWLDTQDNTLWYREDQISFWIHKTLFTILSLKFIS